MTGTPARLLRGFQAPSQSARTEIFQAKAYRQLPSQTPNCPESQRYEAYRDVRGQVALSTGFITFARLVRTEMFQALPTRGPTQTAVPRCCKLHAASRCGA